MKLFSPAKINLFLKIVGKRPDGYHQLISFMQAINCGDIIDIAPAECDSLRCDDPVIPCDGRNLIMKAIDLFRRKTGWKESFAVTLVKRIPYEAGLGGGSSNAATTLWALNQWSGWALSDQELMAWGAELGSDVPFFFSQGTALCTGRGEEVQPLPLLPLQPVTLIKPKIGLSTPVVYANLDINSLPLRDPEKALEAFYRGESDSFNDLETTAFRLMPSLATLKEEGLNKGFSSVTLCGSGSALFCLGEGSSFISNSSFYTFQASFKTRVKGEWYLQRCCINNH